MDIKLGANIAALRKSKGMTQEQLASAVGVSPPAVSKWETDASCPDIALLCPLARALGTNVDTLLQFEAALSEEELTLRINEIVEVARTKDCQSAEAMLQKLLRTYPSSSSLKYHAAAVLDVFAMLHLNPMENQEKKEEWRKQKKQLWEEIYHGGPSSYWQQAVSGLVSAAILEDDLDKAELLLKELPEHTADTSMLWSRLHLKRGETEKAAEVTQKRLFVLVRQVQICLISMMNKELEPDAEKMLEICKIYRQTENVFGVGEGLSDGFFVEAYQRMGQPKKAMDHMIKMINATMVPMRMPKSLLFSAAVKKTDGKQSAVTKEMKEMLLHGILTDDTYTQYREDKEFQAAVERLRLSINENSAES